MELTNLDKELLQALINNNSNLYLNKSGKNYRVKLLIYKYVSKNLPFSCYGNVISGINAFNLLEQVTIYNEQLKYRYAVLLPYKELLTTSKRYTDEDRFVLNRLHKELSCINK